MGAVEWLKLHGIEGDVWQHITKEDIEMLPTGSIVIGVLPLHLAVHVLDCGSRFWSLSVNVPPELRGKELSADQMDCSLQELQLIWRDYRGNPHYNCEETRTGVPSPTMGDCQKFEIGLVPRSAGDLVEAESLNGLPPSTPFQAVDLPE